MYMYTLRTARLSYRRQVHRPKLRRLMNVVGSLVTHTFTRLNDEMLRFSVKRICPDGGHRVPTSNTFIISNEGGCALRSAVRRKVQALGDRYHRQPLSSLDLISHDRPEKCTR